VLYCAGGVRSILAAETLQKLGYKDVYSLQGGIGAWKNAKYFFEDARQNYTPAE
jgi:rhodanese-related sulfurtransferase